jgi:IMP dehydrogenase
MDTVTEANLAIAMHTMGGLGILHRFMNVDQQVEQVRLVKEAGATIISASIGVNGDYKERAEALVKAGVNLMTIDIAHGHSVHMMDTLKWLKDKFSGLEVIAGNLAMPEAAIDLIEAGADAIKVGIGPGSMCTTRIITGAGVPQLTAIALCAEAAESYEKVVDLPEDVGVGNKHKIVRKKTVIDNG